MRTSSVLSLALAALSRALMQAALAALALNGCGGPPPPPPVADAGMDLAAPVDLGPRSTLSDDEAQKARTACTFTAGAMPGETLAKDAPIGPQLPIDTVVIIMMENRSFDHLLGDLPAAGQKDVEVAPPAASNPDAKGDPVARFHLDHFCFDDTNHEWDGSHRQYDDGKMDGFVVTNQGGLGDPDGRRAMGYQTKDDLPFLYSLATNFAIADHYHCSLLGPTFPNREYLYAATSFGQTENNVFTETKPTLVRALDAAGVDRHEYFESAPGSGMFGDFHNNDVYKIDDPNNPLFADIAEGALAPVTFIDPNLSDEDGSAHDDDHPPASAQAGDRFLQTILAELMKGPQWPHMAIFITWDEHGGLYDHVPPPAACPPDGLGPVDGKGNPLPGAFDRLGVRVPLIVVSPYARPHFVSHATYDHTSITRFVEARFLIPALTKRDANASPLYELFDFSTPALLAPPALPDAPLDPAQQAYCQATFPFPRPDGGGAPDGGAPDGGAH